MAFSRRRDGPRQNPLNDSLPLIPEAPPRPQPNRHPKINPPKLGARVQTVDSRCERCRSTGTKEERADIIANRLIPQDVEVCITCYEHIKKVDSIRSEIVCSFISHKKTIHAVEPQIFVDYAYCNSFLHNEVVEALHKILRLFLLMRVKSDVEKNLLPKRDINISVGLMDMQRKWHRSVLENDIDAVNGLTRKKDGKTRLINMIMKLRKVTCHPYLCNGAEPGSLYQQALRRKLGQDDPRQAP
ncbi:hypothetical protein PILCRDRAFT_10079 [Piloderma croceum F 1598]|uniref:SNF2 N-terminal domain-containing protein n=1 Tax=Piloderma croceum (strain F 1598) TaxID=765440 RepID=A0A0C3B110_PILCF|nr:hypothetical protein PILCRDRAFT_10079 [Piloderma croceum F 1598]